MTGDALSRAVVALSRAERALEKANREIRRLRRVLLDHLLNDHPDRNGETHAEHLRALLGDPEDTP
jgi:hypothetical protein